MDALKMDFPDNSFDLVWGCESGEHMPDKTKYFPRPIVLIAMSVYDEHSVGLSIRPAV